MEYKTYIGSLSLIQEICTQSATNYPPRQAIKNLRVDASPDRCPKLLRPAMGFAPHHAAHAPPIDGVPIQMRLQLWLPSSRPAGASNCRQQVVPAFANIGAVRDSIAMSVASFHGRCKEPPHHRRLYPWCNIPGKTSRTRSLPEGYPFASHPGVVLNIDWLSHHPSADHFMIVCSCNVLSDHDVRSAASAAEHLPRNAKQLYHCLGCNAECGRCARTIKTIVDQALSNCRPD
jgi:bacterioferritin-associated ferredoxin